MVFLAVVVLLLSLFTALGLVLEQQAEGLYATVVDIISHLPEYLQAWTSQPIKIGPFPIDLSGFDLAPIYEQVISSARSILGQTGVLITTFFSRAFTFIGWLTFILVVAYYLLNDFHNLGPSVDRMAVPSYSGDIHRLRQELGVIWNAFLRGQILLAISMGLGTIVIMTLLGVRYSLVLGLLAGFTEFIPIIGPLIAGTVAVLVAFFQPSNWLGLSPLTYAAVVLLAAVLLQQWENNFLVPRILGRTLNLHPVLIMVGAIVGASLAGVLGLLLSAPMVATVRLLSRYAYRKMLDLPPFPDPAPGPPPAQRFGWLNPLKGLIRKFTRAESVNPDLPEQAADEALDATSTPLPPVAVPDGIPTGASTPAQILLVDDDPDILELLDLSLKRAGYEVVTARDGEEALRRLTEFHPALILLDLMMPGLDGYETLRDIRQLSDAQIMVVSALSDSREVTRALDAGAVDYLAKPFHPSELVSRVGAVLRRLESAEAK